MKITKISVNSGETINHPYENYSNLRIGIHLEAELAEQDNMIYRARELQIQADSLCMEHKDRLLDALKIKHRCQEGRLVDAEYEP